MSAVSKLSAHGKRIFKLPSRREVGLFLLFSLALLVASCTPRMKVFTSAAAFCGAIATMPLIDAGVARLFRARGAITIRRASFAAVITALAFTVGFAVNLLEISLPLVVATISVLRGVVYGPLLSEHLWISVTSAQLGLVAPLFVMVAIGAAGPVSVLLAVFVGSLASLGFHMLLDRAIDKVCGVRGFALVRGFSRAWLSDEYDDLERIFGRLGTLVRVDVQVLKFITRGDIEFAVIVPWVHNGPFRGIGSSALPALLADTPTFLAKAPSTHENNLVSRKEAEKVVNTAFNAGVLESLDGTVSGIATGQHEGARAMCFLIGDVAVVILSSAPLEMEDIPAWVGTKIRETAKSVGLRDAIVIDAHNSLSSPLFHQTNRGENFVKVAEEALKEAIKLERGVLFVGFSRRKSEARGVESYGLSALVFKVPSGAASFISIDANNITPALRERIIAAVRESCGVSEVEVLTTDTHEGAGVAGASYEILNDARVLKEVVDLVNDAVSRVERASVSYGVTTVETIAFGERGIRLLAAAADAGFRAAKLGVHIVVLALCALALIMALA